MNILIVSAGGLLGYETTNIFLNKKFKGIYYNKKAIKDQ